MKRFLLDQISTNARKIAFRQACQLHVKKMCNRQIQHRITEKLEAFVVVRRKTAMREREL